MRKNERFWAEPRKGVRSAQPNTRLCRMHTATPGHSLQPLLSYSKVSETMGPLVLLLLNYKSVPISDEFFFGQLTELAPDQARGRQASDLSILFFATCIFRQNPWCSTAFLFITTQEKGSFEISWGRDLPPGKLPLRWALLGCNVEHEPVLIKGCDQHIFSCISAQLPRFCSKSTGSVPAIKPGPLSMMQEGTHQMNRRRRSCKKKRHRHSHENCMQNFLII